MTTLSYSLLQTLRRGADCLSHEARAAVVRFVESQRTADESFINRGGKPDLYYTMFGWMLCYALGIRSVGSLRQAYLANIDTPQLDNLHLTVLTLCRQTDRLLALPRHTPDALVRFIAGDRPLRSFFDTYQRHGSGEGTNAWAACLATAPVADPELSARLLAMQHPSGGFLAGDGALMPDLLSTAVALFALRRHNIAVRYDAHPFLEAHWQDDGSFAATLLDENGDAEYEFYGLLALGALKN